jgi:hypothetical protein
MKKNKSLKITRWFKKIGNKSSQLFFGLKKETKQSSVISQQGSHRSTVIGDQSSKASSVTVHPPSLRYGETSRSSEKSLKRFLLVTSDRLLMTIKKLFNFFTRRSFSEGGILSKLARFCFNTKTRSAISLVLIISLLTTGGFLLYKNQQSSAQYTYETNQSDWSGGEDTSSTATISTMDGWSKYYSKSPFINTGSSVSALNPVQQIVDTSDTDFGEGTLDKVEITGSGEGASLEMSGNRKVVAGNGYTCALVGAGKISCWGYNGSGQLGIDEPVEDVFNPSYVLGISNAVDIAAKHSHTCALLDNGTIKCWGYNSSGQLGDGTTSTRRSPVLVSDISTATQVVVEYNHTCAVLEDRTVKCWGADYGSVPVLVPALSNVTQITAGYNHTCAVLEDGTAKCWGDNAQGQLGNNSTTDSLTPVSVSNISTATQITAGRLYTLQP